MTVEAAYCVGFLTGLVGAALYFWIGRYIRRRRQRKASRELIKRLQSQQATGMPSGVLGDSDLRPYPGGLGEKEANRP